nr:hypothetical protein [Mycobacterium ulcerans]
MLFDSLQADELIEIALGAFKYLAGLLSLLGSPEIGQAGAGVWIPPIGTRRDRFRGRHRHAVAGIIESSRRIWAQLTVTTSRAEFFDRGFFVS